MVNFIQFVLWLQRSAAIESQFVMMICRVWFLDFIEISALFICTLIINHRNLKLLLSLRANVIYTRCHEYGLGRLEFS